MTTIRFLHQVLIDRHVFAEGEVVEVLDKIAKFAIEHNHAVKATPAPAPEVREAVSQPPARKATKKA